MKDPNSTEEERNVARDNIRNLEKEGEMLQERENYLSRFKSLRGNIRAIFTEHGFTVLAVITAASTIIGVVISKLTSGLKGLGNGLKDIRTKLANLFPGMIGAIASFIFKTAGEAIGFLTKNAWLLIIAVAVYFVEQ